MKLAKEDAFNCLGTQKAMSANYKLAPGKEMETLESSVWTRMQPAIPLRIIFL
jgi:hypothetical protein